MFTDLQSRLYLSLDNPAPFRYGFFTILILAPFLIYGVSYSFPEIELYPLYLIAPVCLGIGFWDQSKLLIILLSSLIIVCRTFLNPEPTSDIVSTLVLWFVYLLVTFISVGLTKNYRKTTEIKLELILALANSLDSRDAYTAYHSENVAKYATMIAKELKLSKKICDAIYIGGLLHDIGKIGVPEHILMKAGSLTNEEYEIIKRHPVIGYDTIKHISAFKQNGVLDMVLYHHERYDGKGYPKGLKGEQIPLVARIMAVADTFDAMTSNRVYRNRMDFEYVLAEIYNNKSSQFDPQIADVLFSILQREGTKILSNGADKNHQKNV